MLCSRVHITEAALYKLDNEYHVEPYLSDPVQTYLIVSNQVKLDIAPQTQNLQNVTQNSITLLEILKKKTLSFLWCPRRFC